MTPATRSSRGPVWLQLPGTPYLAEGGGHVTGFPLLPHVDRFRIADNPRANRNETVALGRQGWVIGTEKFSR